MSWWETGTERLTIGDAPADKITDGLKRIAAARRQNGQSEPSLPELLSSLQSVLKQSDPQLHPLVATTSVGKVAVGSGHDPKLQEDVADIVRAVTDAYVDELKRKPRTKEVLACFEFVLGFEPERYLSNLAGSSIDAIETESN
jgi:hypothetical protein